MTLLKFAQRVGLKHWFVLLILSQAVYLTMLLGSIPAIQANADGLPVFDLRPLGYQLEEAQRFLSRLNKAGLSVYRNLQLPLDLVFPPLMASFLIATWVLLQRVVRWPGPRLLNVILMLTVFTCISDWLENLAILVMLERGQEVDGGLVATASVLTQFKSWVTVVDDALLSVYAVTALVVWLSKGRK